MKTVDWPMYGHDQERTRYLPSKHLDPPFGSSLWSFQAGKLLEFQPIVVKGTLYFMDKDGEFYALSADRGQVQWKRKIGTLNASSPAYSDGRLFAVNLEPAAGGRDSPAPPRQRRPVAPPPAGAKRVLPLVHGGKVIFGCESGDIFALDAKTGKTDWTVHTGGPVKGALAYDRAPSSPPTTRARCGPWTRGTATSSGRPTRRAAASCAAAASTRRRRSPGAGSTSGGLDGRVYSYVEKTGELAWSHSTGAEVYPAPAVADTPREPATVYLGSQDKNFYALDARTGAVRWQKSIDGIVLGSSSVVGETVYVSAIGPNIGTFGFDVKNGKKVFYNDQGEYNPVISDGKNIFLTGASTIRAFEPEAPASRQSRAQAGAGKRAQHASGKPGGSGG